MPAPIRCLLVDDQPEILNFLAAILGEEGIEVVGLAECASAALALIKIRRPAVALIDLRLPDATGVELISAATLATPDTACLLYTGDADWPKAREALDAGARGVLLKESPLHDVSRAIRRVAGGGRYIDPLLGGELAAPRGGHMRRLDPPASPE